MPCAAILWIFIYARLIWDREPILFGNSPEEIRKFRYTPRFLSLAAIGFPVTLLRGEKATKMMIKSQVGMVFGF